MRIGGGRVSPQKTNRAAGLVLLLSVFKPRNASLVRNNQPNLILCPWRRGIKKGEGK